MRGIILKGVGSFYSVLSDANESYTCKARGKFRIDGVTPLPGDRVEFEPLGNGEGYLQHVLPRKNAFTRPMVANIDKLFIVLAASAPKPDLLLTDRLLLSCARESVTPVLVLNKCDERDEALYQDVLEQYGPAGLLIISASAHEKTGLESIKREIENSVCCFTGQSAVGKSSLLNALFPSLDLPVGDMSRKVDRGKHTTRHAELWPFYGGAVVDTPGFSLLETDSMEPEALDALYPEMQGARLNCYFTACMHISEPDCAVKALLSEGGISKGRYERYCALAKELIEMRKHRYD